MTDSKPLRPVFHAEVISNHRITIPKGIRKVMDIKVGETLELQILKKFEEEKPGAKGS